MRRNIYCALLFILLGLVSCDILDTEPLDSYHENVVWEHEDLAENVLREAYWSILKSLYCQGNNSTECLLTEAWSDNVYNKDNNSVAAEAISPTNINSNIGDFNKYGYIRKVSLIIEKLTNNPNIEEQKCKRFIAEARCLRVLVYSWMARRWGGVMLVDKLMTPQDEMLLPRATEQEMYQFMINELKLAIPDLPSVCGKERFTKGAALTLLTRVALDGAFYDEVIAAGNELIEGEEAVNWDLDSDYRRMFGSFSYPEQSREIQFYFTEGGRKQYCDNLLPMYVAGVLSPGRNIMGPPMTVKIDTWCVNWPSHELTEAYLAIDVEGDKSAKPYYETKHWKEAPTKTAAIMYSNRDKRFMATICYDGTTYFGDPIETDTLGNQFWNNTQNHPFMTQSGYLWRKYIYELDGVESAPSYQKLYDFRYILLRLGEAYLNYAEALGRKGEIKKAIQIMNKTRTIHGGLPALSENSSEEVFWKYYKIERRVELVLEGDRYFSVIRWAKAENATSVPEFNKKTNAIIIYGDNDLFELTDKSHGSSTGSERVFSWPKRMYFPLPESELMNNPNLKQNKYW